MNSKLKDLAPKMPALPTLGDMYEFVQRIGWTVIVASCVATQASAQAGGGSDPSAILTALINFITGAFGQSIAILGIIAIGLSWMFGRASLGLVAGVVGGIVIMFGASYLARTALAVGGGA